MSSWPTLIYTAPTTIIISGIVGAVAMLINPFGVDGHLCFSVNPHMRRRAVSTSISRVIGHVAFKPLFASTRRGPIVAMSCPDCGMRMLCGSKKSAQA